MAKYKFKKNQKVKFIYNIDFTDTGGPYIPRGSIAIVIKRIRNENAVWLKSDDFGIHKMNDSYLVDA